MIGKGGRCLEDGWGIGEGTRPLPFGCFGVAPVAAVGCGTRVGWIGVEVNKKGSRCGGGMLTFGLSVTAGGGRVAGLRIGREG